MTNVEVVTFGCRLNTFESEIIKSHAKENSLDNTIIFNTCAVTSEAERQARQAIRKAKLENPNIKIIVTGCSAQINPQKYSDMPEVDQVLGNVEKMQVESYSNTSPVVISDIMQATQTAHHLIAGFEEKSRGFIEIQNGCNHRCTFCTIPYGRGNNRSVPIAEIVNRIRTLIENGCQEIIFTGVDITGYGEDLPGSPTLGQMTRRVLNQVPELQRLRLSSLDPAEVDEDIFKLLAEEPRLMPHIHISLQSGDDMILKRMKRRHLSQDVRFFCHHVRSLRPDVVFGADVIAGFPTETDEMHSNTIKLLEECDITYLHVFPYSAREYTPAAKMPQVSGDIIKKRAKELRQLAYMAQEKFLRSKVGCEVAVLTERNNTGRCPHFTSIKFLEPVTEGQIVQAVISGFENGTLVGRILRRKAA